MLWSALRMLRVPRRPVSADLLEGCWRIAWRGPAGCLFSRGRAMVSEQMFEELCGKARERAVVARRREFGSDRSVGWAKSLDYGFGHVALLLMGDAGLRSCEVCGLRYGDVVLGGEVAVVLRLRGAICKGGRGREVPMTDALRSALRGVMDWYRPRWWGAEGDWLIRGGRSDGSLSTRQLRRWVTAASCFLVGASVRPHQLRHLFGRRVRRVADVAIAQRLLGHRDLRTTEIYTRADVDECWGAIKAMNHAASR